MKTEIYDITVPISPALPVWPGDPTVAIRQLASIDKGDEANISLIRMGVHTGTHIDAPKHFLDDGKTIEQIELQKLVGQVLVMEIDKTAEVITEQAVTQNALFESLHRVKKVLFKTRNSDIWHTDGSQFREDYTGLDQSAAQCLADLEMDLVGVDYLSIATFKETAEPHQILLEKEVVLLEGIDLTGVQEGLYEIYCLPLLLSACEGAPARVILISG